MPKYGIVDISNAFLEEQFIDIMKILQAKSWFILRNNIRYNSKTYLIESDLFDEVKSGEAIKTYNIAINYENGVYTPEVKDSFVSNF